MPEPNNAIEPDASIKLNNSEPGTVELEIGKLGSLSKLEVVVEQQDKVEYVRIYQIGSY